MSVTALWGATVEAPPCLPVLATPVLRDTIISSRRTVVVLVVTARGFPDDVLWRSLGEFPCDSIIKQERFSSQLMT